MQVQLEGQIRMIRVFFSQVLKNWEARYLNTVVKGPYLFPCPLSCKPFPRLNKTMSHNLLLEGRVSSPDQCSGVPWPHPGLSRPFLNWGPQNSSHCPRQDFALVPFYGSCFPFHPVWLLWVATLPLSASTGPHGLVSPTHSLEEQSASFFSP